MWVVYRCLPVEEITRLCSCVFPLKTAKLIVVAVFFAGIIPGCAPHLLQRGWVGEVVKGETALLLLDGFGCGAALQSWGELTDYLQVLGVGFQVHRVHHGVGVGLDGPDDVVEWLLEVLALQQKSIDLQLIRLEDSVQEIGAFIRFILMGFHLFFEPVQVHQQSYP